MSRGATDHGKCPSATSLMATLVFLDPAAPNAYTAETFKASNCHLGATEWATVQVAEGLSARGHEVYIFQKKRSHSETCNGVHYCPVAMAGEVDPDIVVLLRFPKELSSVRYLWPLAQPILWLHNPHEPSIADDYPLIMKSEATILCGSAFHQEHILGLLNGAEGYQEDPPIRHIYLPLEEELQADDTAYDKNLLVFASSPSKGLEGVLQLFEAARQEIPSLQLQVFNPGYIKKDLQAPEGVSFMGRRPREEVIQSMREALCLFHVQTVEPETFGMVYVEAHAVGTPVLSHNHGSAPELLSPEELVDAHKTADVVEKVRDWHSGARPTVVSSDKYLRGNVLDQWETLIAKTTDQAPSR